MRLQFTGLLSPLYFCCAGRYGATARGEEERACSAPSSNAAQAAGKRTLPCLGWILLHPEERWDHRDHQVTVGDRALALLLSWLCLCLSIGSRLTRTALSVLSENWLCKANFWESSTCKCPGDCPGASSHSSAGKKGLIKQNCCFKASTSLVFFTIIVISLF